MLPNDNMLMGGLRNMLLLVCLLTGIRQAYSQPESKADTISAISFDSLTINLDTIYKDTPVRKFCIRYQNRGRHKATIKNIEVGCGCTEVEYSKEAIAPGATDSLKVTLDMSTFSTGPFVKDIYVYTDDSSSPIEIILNGGLWYRKE